MAGNSANGSLPAPSLHWLAYSGSCTADSIAADYRGTAAPAHQTLVRVFERAAPSAPSRHPPLTLRACGVPDFHLWSVWLFSLSPTEGIHHENRRDGRRRRGLLLRRHARPPL